MALTEQFFYDIIHDIMGENIGHHAKKMIAKQCKISHDADCDFVAERAFKAGVDSENAFWQFQKSLITVFEREKRYFKTYQDYKNSQNT